MNEPSVGLSDANAEAAASMGIACSRERRVEFIESLLMGGEPRTRQRSYRLPNASNQDSLRAGKKAGPGGAQLSGRQTASFTDKIDGNKSTGAQ
jgi:hypothetical protein